MITASLLGSHSDLFIFAQRIPNLFRRLFAEGSFSQAFTPIFSKYHQEEDQSKTRQLFASAFGWLSLITLTITLIGVIGSGIITMILANGWYEGYANGANPMHYLEASFLLKITFPYLFFISLTALCGSVFNTLGKFWIFSFTPTLLNISLIVCALILPQYLNGDANLALSIGVFVGGFIQLAFQIPFLKANGMLVMPSLKITEGLSRMFKKLVPALIGSSASQINMLVNTVVASFFAVGSLSWLYYSERLLELPLGVFGVAISTVILPTLSRKANILQKEPSQEAKLEYQKVLDWGVKCIFVVALPAMVGLITLGKYIINILFVHGEFNGHTDLINTNLALICYTFSMIPSMLAKTLANGLFSYENTKTPMLISLAVILLNIILNIYALNHDFWFLAIATSISACFNAGLLYTSLRKRNIYKFSKDVLITVAKSIVAACIMAVILTLMPEDYNSWVTYKYEWTKIVLLLFWGIVGVSSYLIVLYLLDYKITDLHYIEKDDKLKINSINTNIKSNIDSNIKNTIDANLNQQIDLEKSTQETKVNIPSYSSSSNYSQEHIQQSHNLKSSRKKRKTKRVTSKSQTIKDKLVKVEQEVNILKDISLAQVESDLYKKPKPLIQNQELNNQELYKVNNIQIKELVKQATPIKQVQSIPMDITLDMHRVLAITSLSKIISQPVIQQEYKQAKQFRTPVDCRQDMIRVNLIACLGKLIRPNQQVITSNSKTKAINDITLDIARVLAIPNLGKETVTTAQHYFKNVILNCRQDIAIVGSIASLGKLIKSKTLAIVEKTVEKTTKDICKITELTITPSKDISKDLGRVLATTSLGNIIKPSKACVKAKNITVNKSNSKISGNVIKDMASVNAVASLTKVLDNAGSPTLSNVDVHKVKEIPPFTSVEEKREALVGKSPIAPPTVNKAKAIAKAQAKVAQLDKTIKTENNWIENNWTENSKPEINQKFKNFSLSIQEVDQKEIKQKNLLDNNEVESNLNQKQNLDKRQRSHASQNILNEQDLASIKNASKVKDTVLFGQVLFEGNLRATQKEILENKDKFNSLAKVKVQDISNLLPVGINTDSTDFVDSQVPNERTNFKAFIGDHKQANKLDNNLDNKLDNKLNNSQTKGESYTSVTSNVRANSSTNTSIFTPYIDIEKDANSLKHSVVVNPLQELISELKNNLITTWDSGSTTSDIFKDVKLDSKLERTSDNKVKGKSKAKIDVNWELDMQKFLDHNQIGMVSSSSVLIENEKGQLVNALQIPQSEQIIKPSTVQSYITQTTNKHVGNVYINKTTPTNVNFKSDDFDFSTNSLPHLEEIDFEFDASEFYEVFEAFEAREFDAQQSKENNQAN